jgi:hypothetical protein
MIKRPICTYALYIALTDMRQRLWNAWGLFDGGMEAVERQDQSRGHADDLTSSTGVSHPTFPSWKRGRRSDRSRTQREPKIRLAAMEEKCHA